MEQKNILFPNVISSNNMIKENLEEDTIKKTVKEVQDIIEECPNCEQTMYNSVCKNCGYGSNISNLGQYFSKDIGKEGKVEGKEKNKNIFKISLANINIGKGFHTASFDSVHSKICDENEKSVMIINIGKHRYKISMTYNMYSEIIFIKRADIKIKNGWKRVYIPLTDSLHFAIKSIIFNDTYNTYL